MKKQDYESIAMFNYPYGYNHGSEKGHHEIMRMKLPSGKRQYVLIWIKDK